MNHLAGISILLSESNSNIQLTTSECNAPARLSQVAQVTQGPETAFRDIWIIASEILDATTLIANWRPFISLVGNRDYWQRSDC
jgi:hypothetical protein